MLQSHNQSKMSTHTSSLSLSLIIRSHISPPLTTITHRGPHFHSSNPKSVPPIFYLSHPTLQLKLTSPPLPFPSLTNQTSDTPPHLWPRPWEPLTSLHIEPVANARGREHVSPSRPLWLQLLANEYLPLTNGL